MISDRHTAIVYTSSICNLKCTYCYIDKNPALQTIDKVLEESFEGDYYINFIKEMMPNPLQLTSLETWGGEPFIGMHRIYNLVQQLIDFYPNFNSFFSSTNLTLPNWIEEFSGLVDVFSKNKDRHFNMCIQLSIDGPAYINDKNRGEGVTKKIEANFDRLIEYLKDFPSNISLTIQPKPTFDMDCIKMLDSKEKIIEYYQYLETYIEKVVQLNNHHIVMVPNIPNTACPYPHTQEDGKIMANLCKMTREIEMNNPLKYYDEITLFSKGYKCTEGMSYRCTNFTCGSGYTNVGFLPYDKISTCHNGFVDLISDYKKLAINNKDSVLDFKFFIENSKSRFCLTKEEYKLFESQMIHYNTPNTTSRLANVTTSIVALAFAGQIDERYCDYEEALKAAMFLRDKTSFCIRDNYAITGSITLQPLGLYKLLLNGAKEIIQNE